MRYLDQALETYGKSDVYPFHMPGHKRNPLPFPEVYGIDITEIDGFDNLHHAEGILKEAQQPRFQYYCNKNTNCKSCNFLFQSHIYTSILYIFFFSTVIIH